LDRTVMTVAPLIRIGRWCAQPATHHRQNQSPIGAGPGPGRAPRWYGDRVLDHLALQVADADAAAAFYLRTFAPLGLREAMRFEPEGAAVVGLSGPDGFPHLWFGPLVDPGVRPVHLALTAPSRAAVDEVFALASASGIEVLHAPRLWPEYHAGYYAVFLRDPDGNNVEAVHHSFDGTNPAASTVEGSVISDK
jgi:catechol 2,3-dioxygenase-like lactoylglutathione lyase family enzyme